MKLPLEREAQSAPRFHRWPSVSIFLPIAVCLGGGSACRKDREQKTPPKLEAPASSDSAVAAAASPQPAAASVKPADGGVAEEQPAAAGEWIPGGFYNFRLEEIHACGAP